MLVLDSTAFLTTKDYKESLLFQLNSELFYYWMRTNVHEYGESGFRLSNQYVSIYPALNRDVLDKSELYNCYNFTKEEIDVIESKK